MSYDLDIHSSILEPDRLKKFSRIYCARKIVCKWAITQVNGVRILRCCLNAWTWESRGGVALTDCCSGRWRRRRTSRSSWTREYATSTWGSLGSRMTRTPRGFTFITGCTPGRMWRWRGKSLVWSSGHCFSSPAIHKDVGACICNQYFCFKPSVCVTTQTMK